MPYENTSRTIIVRNWLRRALKLGRDAVACDMLEELAVAGVDEGELRKRVRSGLLRVLEPRKERQSMRASETARESGRKACLRTFDLCVKRQSAVPTVGPKRKPIPGTSA